MLDALRSLAVFAKVAELGSFRAAARALSLSPSVVSHHVSELEQRLALPLLYRSTRRVALTPDGERLVPAAREMVSAAERGLDAVSGRTATLTGTLRLTAPAFFAETGFCRELGAFAKEHPGLRLSVSFTESPRDLLKDGLDLALRAGRLEDSTHKARRLADMHRVLVASPQYLKGRPAPSSPRDLEGWDFLQLASRPPELVLSAAGKKPVHVRFEPRMTIDSAAAMRELLLASVAAAMLPEILVRADLAKGRLVEVLPAFHSPVLGVFAVWPQSAQRAALTLRFVEAMEARIRHLFAVPPRLGG